MAGLIERVLIVGGAGQLGQELQAAFADRDVLAPARTELDLEEPDSVAAALGRFRPTLVVNAAAYHHVERCEIFPHRAFAVNALAVDRLAAACALSGGVLATISTDYVFGGEACEPYREADPTNPLNAYGASKLAGEHLVRRHGDRHLIVRTSGLYGRRPSSVKGYTFVARVLAQAEAGERVRVVDDITFSPSYAPDVAAAVRRIAERGEFGTYHVTNAGATTWYAFAAAAFEIAGCTADLVAVSSSAFGSRVRRPAYSALANAALESAGIAAPRPWRAALAAYIRERAAA